MLSCMPTYNIPKKKARLKVEKLSSGSREYRQYHRAFYDSIFSIRTISKYYFVNNIYEVHSPGLESRYNRQRKIWREKGYTEELTSDTLCFLNIDDHSLQSVSEILKSGIEAGNLAESVLCDPALGVQVSKHADVTSENILRDAERTILVFKFMKGKVKTVDEQMEHLSEMRREPQVGFDTLTSQLMAKQSDSLFLSRMYYIFHFESEMDEVPAQRPPQICPVAFINFRHELNSKNSVPMEPKFCMDTLLRYMETGKLPQSLEKGRNTSTPESSAVQSTSTVVEKSHKGSRYGRKAQFSDPKIPDTNTQEERATSEDMEDAEPDLYEPTTDMRDRPSFLKLTKESAKWRELADAFNADVCRDADFITVTEMYYIVAQKLLDKYSSIKEHWSSIGYSQYQTSDLHGYINVTSHTIKQLGEITSNGLAVGNLAYSVLADPTRGVQVSQCPDLLSTAREMAYEKLVLMFKYMPGQQIEVADTFEHRELPSPISGFDSIVSTHRHSSHASHSSRLTYLYTYKSSADAANPSHICPIAFLRIKYRKGLRHKIPAVKVPDIEALKKCMSTVKSRPLTQEPLSRRSSAPAGNNSSDDLNSSAKFKSAENRQIHMFSPSSLKRTMSAPRSYSNSKSRKVQSQSESRNTSSEQSLVKEAIERSLIESVDETSSEPAFQQPKPVLSGSKVKNFKSLLKKAITTPAAADEETAQSSVGSADSDAPMDVSQDTSGENSVPFSSAADSKPSLQTDVAADSKPSLQADVAGDSSSDESLVMKHVPKLSYGRGKRNRVLSSDSPTESESDSPLRMTSRRAARVIDSDESEADDSIKPKKRVTLTKFRRTPAMTHFAVYLSDCATTVISCANDDTIVVEPVHSEVSDCKPTALSIHPLIFDKKLELKDLTFPKHNLEDLTFSTSFSMKEVRFELELWGIKEESVKIPNNTAASSNSAAVQSDQKKSPESINQAAFTDRDRSITSKSDLSTDLSKVLSADPTKERSKGLAKDPTKEQSKGLAKDPTKEQSKGLAKDPTKEQSKGLAKDPTKEQSKSLAKDPTKEQSKGLAKDPTKEQSKGLAKDSTKEQSKWLAKDPTKEQSTGLAKDPTKEQSKGLAKDPTKEQSKGLAKGSTKETLEETAEEAVAVLKDLSESTAKVENASKAVIVDDHESKPKDPKKSSAPTTPPPSETKKAVYEEVDIFASVRIQSAEKIVKRKRRKSVSAPSPVNKEPTVEAPEPENISKKSVHFNFDLNTVHYYESDTDSRVSEKKPAQQDNVNKEALPMKKRPMFPHSDHIKPVNILAPVASKIEGESLKPIVDTFKGYMRLPDLPMFYEKPRKDSLPGSVPKDEGGSSLAPKMPEALLHPPNINEAPTSSRPEVHTPFTSTDKRQFTFSEASPLTFAAPPLPIPLVALPTVSSVGLPTASPATLSGVASTTIAGVVPPVISGVAPPTIPSVTPPTVSIVAAHTISRVTPPTISGITPPTIPVAAPLTISGVAPPTISGVTLPLLLGVHPSTKVDSIAGTSLFKTLNAKSGITSPLSCAGDTPVILSSSSSRLSDKVSSACDVENATTSSVSNDSATAVVPGIGTPYSPDEETSDPDFNDIDKMLEASEAEKNAKKSALLAISSEITKFMDNVRSLAQPAKNQKVTQGSSSKLQMQVKQPTQTVQKSFVEISSIDTSKNTTSSAFILQSTPSKNVISYDPRLLSTKSYTLSSDLIVSPPPPPPLTPVTQPFQQLPKATSVSGESLKSAVGHTSGILASSNTLDKHVATKLPNHSKPSEMINSDTSALKTDKSHKPVSSSKLYILPPTTVTYDTIEPSIAKLALEKKMSPLPASSFCNLQTEVVEKQSHPQHLSTSVTKTNITKISSDRKIKFSLCGNEFLSNQKKQKLEADKANIESQPSLLTATDLKKLSSLSTLPSCLVNLGKRSSASKPAAESGPFNVSSATTASFTISTPSVSAGKAVKSSSLEIGNNSNDLGEVKESSSVTEHFHLDAGEVLALVKDSKVADSLDTIKGVRSEHSTGKEQLPQNSKKITDKVEEPNFSQYTPDTVTTSKIEQSVSATQQSQMNPAKQTNKSTESRLESTSDTIKALNSIAVKSHLPSQLVIAKKPVRLDATKSGSKISTEAPSSVEFPEPTKDKLSDSENIKIGERVSLITDNSSQDRTMADSSDNTTPVSDSTMVFKELFKFKGRKLPKSLLIDKSPNERMGSLLSSVENKCSAQKTGTTPGCAETSQTSAEYFQPIKSTMSSLELTGSGKTHSRVNEVESAHFIPLKRSRFDDSWTRHLSTRTKRQMKSIERCTNFLQNHDCIRKLNDITGYIDPHLDTADEKARLKILSYPIFHKTSIDGCTAASHLIMTCPNEASDDSIKSDAVFWETCPDLSTCTCVSYTTAKELLAKDENFDQVFDNQDEIDTVRLAIAYSKSADSSTEHVVRLTATPALFDHIKPSIVDHCDVMFSELSLSHGMVVDEDIEGTMFNYIIPLNSTDHTSPTDSASSNWASSLLSNKLEGNLSPAVTSSSNANKGNDRNSLPDSTSDIRDDVFSHNETVSSRDTFKNGSKEIYVKSLKASSQSISTNTEIKNVDSSSNIIEGDNSLKVLKASSLCAVDEPDSSDQPLDPIEEITVGDFMESCISVDTNLTGHHARPQAYYVASVVEASAVSPFTLLALPSVSLVQATSSVEDIQFNFPVLSYPDSFTNVLSAVGHVASARIVTEQSTGSNIALPSVHVEDLKLAATIVSVDSPIHIAAMHAKAKHSHPLHMSTTESAVISVASTCSASNNWLENLAINKPNEIADLPVVKDELTENFSITKKALNLAYNVSQPTYAQSATIVSGDVNWPFQATEPNEYSSVKVLNPVTIATPSLYFVEHFPHLRMLEKITTHKKMLSISSVRGLTVEEAHLLNVSIPIISVQPSVITSDVKSVATVTKIQHMERVISSFPVNVQKSGGIVSCDTLSAGCFSISPSKVLCNTPIVIDPISLPPLLPTPSRDVHSTYLLSTPKDMRSTLPLLPTPTENVHSAPSLLPTPFFKLQSTQPLLPTPSINVQSIIKKINSVKRVNNNVSHNEGLAKDQRSTVTVKPINDKSRKILSYAHSFDSEPEDENQPGKADVQVEGPKTKRHKKSFHPWSEMKKHSPSRSETHGTGYVKNSKAVRKSILKNPFPSGYDSQVAPSLSKTIVNDSTMTKPPINPQRGAVDPFTVNTYASKMDEVYTSDPKKENPHDFGARSDPDLRDTSVLGNYKIYKDFRYNTPDQINCRKSQDDLTTNEQIYSPSHAIFLGNSSESYSQINRNVTSESLDDHLKESQDQAGKLLQLAKLVNTNDISFGDAVKVNFSSQKDGRTTVAKAKISDRLGQKVRDSSEGKLGLFDVSKALQNFDLPNYSRERFEHRDNCRQLRDRELENDGQRLAMPRHSSFNGMGTNRPHPYSPRQHLMANHSRYIPRTDSYPGQNDSDRFLSAPTFSRTAARNQTYRTRPQDQSKS